MESMYKTHLRLPVSSGTFSFNVAFSKPLAARKAIFVLRPYGVFEGTSGSKSSLIWSGQAGGYFLYSPKISKAGILTSKKFTLELETPEVELDVLPWAGGDLAGAIESISLVSKPSDDDSLFTTYFGGLK